MSFKLVVFYAGCVAAWLVLMPLAVIGVGILLLSDAIVSELSEMFTGHPAKSLDNSTAREMARRMCLG